MRVELVSDNKNNVDFLARRRTDTSDRQSAESDRTAGQVTHKRFG